MATSRRPAGRHPPSVAPGRGADGPPLNVALVGQGFMGRAHGNAWGQVGRFFQPPRLPVLHTIAARNAGSLPGFARRWGWAHWTARWQDLAADPDVQLVDIGTPNDSHAEIALAMLAAGKHVACEKPLAATLDDARAMRDAAAAAARRGVQSFVWFNYRRCPAVALGHQLVAEGRLGRLHHVRAHYLQSWGGPDTPLSWRFDAARAGSGAHGDLNAHLVDLVRFLSGEEF
ncbi:MAG TPA: Gfo/Idh/MocA family oxidoreductase, partial [Planctomycetota bacterium]|nr:Gfo/Idh/MocA family oxidoreductase [Planctomycetota bacterium]